MRTLAIEGAAFYTPLIFGYQGSTLHSHIKKWQGISSTKEYSREQIYWKWQFFDGATQFVTSDTKVRRLF